MLSRYEGFGIPILVAMASGAPVISACDGALPEVVGKAGLLLDADDPAEIVAAIKWLSSDLSASDAFRTMGAERAQVYRWARCVERLVDALRSQWPRTTSFANHTPHLRLSSPTTMGDGSAHFFWFSALPSASVRL